MKYDNPYNPFCAHPKRDSCIIKADEWDGDTGIDNLIKRYRAENPMQCPHAQPIERVKRKVIKKAFEWEDDAEHKQCRRCRRVLPHSEFNKSHGGQLGSYCKSCTRELNRQQQRKPKTA